MSASLPWDFTLSRLGFPARTALFARDREGHARIRFSMVNRNLLREYDLPDLELQQELEAAFHRDDTGGDLNAWLPPEEQEFETNKIVTGRVIDIVGENVLVDVGYKS